MSHCIHIVNQGLTDSCRINVANAEFSSVLLDAGIGVDVTHLHLHFQKASDEVSIVII